MLKGKSAAVVLLRLGRRICVCMHRRHIDDGLRDRIRPWWFGSYALWFDKVDNV
jgi:hypothetical protein